MTTKRRSQLLIRMAEGCLIVANLARVRDCSNRVAERACITVGGYRDNRLRHSLVRSETVGKMERAGLIEAFRPHASGPYTHYRITRAGYGAI